MISKYKFKPGCRILLFWVMIPLLLNSCATLTEEECLTINWYNIGYEDGTKGYEISRVALHRKACSKYGVIQDLSLYQQGRSEGLVEYCTPHKGYSQGVNGLTYRDVCQGNLKDPFQQAYYIGRDIYLFQKQIQHEQRDQDSLAKEIDKMDLLIKGKEVQLSKVCKNHRNCTQALNHIRDLDRQIRRLKSEFRSKEYQIHDMRQRLDEMKNQNRF